MAWKAKENILMYAKGDVISDDEMQDNWKPHFESLGIDKVKEPEPVKEEVSKVEGDLNGDGKVDKEDASIASKTMNLFKNKKKNKRGRR